MNKPPNAPKDQRKLPDAPEAQRAHQQAPAQGVPLPAPSSVTASQIPSLPLHGALPPAAMGDISAMNKMAQLGGALPGMMAPFQPKLDPMNLLGAAAAVQQQQQIQNAGLLRSLMDQKQQITKYEDEIRRRMLLPPSDPLLQAHLIQNDPGRFLGGMGLLGNMGPVFNPLATNFSQLPPPKELAFRGDGRSLRGGVIEPFPEKLHRLLQETEAAGLSDVISFVANGRAFTIHKPERFFKEIVPQYFRHKRLSSFKRQLNLYGFELISSGPARGGYYHKMFVQGRPELCVNMRRSVTSKTHSRSREARPDFLLETPTPPNAKEAPPKKVVKAETADQKSAAQEDSPS